MPRTIRALLAVLTALPLSALAQTANVADVGNRPTAIAVPNATAAGGEEPASIQANAAAPGFVAAPSLQYFHEGQHGGGRSADAFFLSTPLGGLVPTLAMDWMRPETGPKFRTTTLGVALSDHRVLSLGFGWTWYQSPDAELDRLTSYAFGFTLRPARWLSLAASADGVGAKLAGERLPARLDFATGFRTLDDRLTLTADLLASDRATGLGDVDVRALALGTQAELVHGLAVYAQLQVPLRSGSDTFLLAGLAFSTPHSGLVAGGSAGAPGSDRWIVGARTSVEAYRAPDPRHRGVRLDLARELSPPRSIFNPGPRDPFGLLLAKLRALRDDESVAAVAVEVDDLALGWGRSGELREALSALAARKPVVAYLVGGRLREYWIATAAQAIAVPPAMALDVAGVSSTTPFLREGLARIGVAFDVVAAGRYKNAPDPLVRQTMSDAQREAQDAILDDTFGRVVADVARARRLEPPRVRELVDRAILTSGEAHEARLVDAVIWPDELDQLASGRASRPVKLGGYAPERRREAQRWGPRPVVAVVPIEGGIVSGRSRGVPGSGPLAGAQSIARELRRAVDDGRVKAIVIRIDSPGGDALASDLLWREVRRAAGRKPVVASMGDAAASGGYLVAVAAPTLIAEPSTLTGSIGVFALKPDLSGLLGKLGVNVVTLRRGEKADLSSATRAWTPAERALLERQVAAFYEGFKARVAEGRRLRPEEVEQLAGGRVWTGAQAKERGLVDRLGSLEDAIALAAERAGLSPADDPDVVRFEPPRRFLEDVVRFAGTSEPSALERVAAALPELRTAALLLEMGETVALPLDWLGPAPDAAHP